MPACFNLHQEAVFVFSVMIDLTSKSLIIPHGMSIFRASDRLPDYVIDDVASSGHRSSIGPPDSVSEGT